MSLAWAADNHPVDSLWLWILQGSSGKTDLFFLKLFILKHETQAE